MDPSLRCTVVGAGAWGTALAKLLAERGHPTTIWAREPEVVAAVNGRHENPAFLPGIPLPAGLVAAGDLDAALAGARVVVGAVPTQFVRSVFSRARPADIAAVVSVAKGIEVDTLATPLQILEACGLEPIVALSGPSFAREVATGTPTAVVAASTDPDAARLTQEIFSTDTFRVYTSDDPLSVEIGGALKNVIAIAAGIVDGLGFGHNTVAALITRGLAELTRLGVAMGGHPLTLAGLSGMGDLVLTCTGGLSRNRHVGLELGRGRPLEEILDAMHEVAEGVRTTRAARDLALRLRVSMPITEAVHAVLYDGADPRRTVTDLMRRALRDERDG